MIQSIIKKITIIIFLATTISYAHSAEFSTLTYNVAGLPEIISSAESDRQSATEEISCYVNEFDIVNVQEDFNYHAALYDTCDDHRYRSSTSGGAGIGSGLNTMSRYPYMDWTRVTWCDCADEDCLTPKGFTLARTRLAEGVYVDIYNLHPQAGIEDDDLEARRANITQLAEYIEAYSAGNAVIIMGDTNTRYTRIEDNIREFLKRGFRDVWVELIRQGDVPEKGSEALVCSPAVTDADCEIVDKILYRDNGFLGLEPYAYQVRKDAINDDGQELSDHRPVVVKWTYNTSSDRQLSDTQGGPHGDAFNDLSVLPATPSPDTLTLRTGKRLDQVQLTLSNGYLMTHGGAGGTVASLALESGEYLIAATLCSGEYNDYTRVFYASFSTSAGNTLSGGTKTDNCSTFSAPDGWSIVGFHGRSGSEVDRLGMIYAKVPSIAAGTAEYKQFINSASGLCMDISGAQMVDGTDVIQWPCSGKDWQLWNYDDYTGMIRSKNDPIYCLDNSGTFTNGANVMIRMCTGNANQRFTQNSDGTFSVRTFTSQVLDGFGTDAGDTVGTWEFWGGSNQYWAFENYWN